MTSDYDTHFEEKIYDQAGEWVRLGNTIIWSTGALFVPLSLGAVPLAIGLDGKQAGLTASTGLLAVASVLLYLLWIYISCLYRGSVMQARTVLMEIEKAHGTPEARSLYVLQKQPSLQGLSLIRMQYLTGTLLVLIWSLYLLVLWIG